MGADRGYKYIKRLSVDSVKFPFILNALISILRHFNYPTRIVIKLNFLIIDYV